MLAFLAMLIELTDFINLKMKTKTVRCDNPQCDGGYIHVVNVTIHGEEHKKKFCPKCGGHRYIIVEIEDGTKIINGYNSDI